MSFEDLQAMWQRHEHSFPHEINTQALIDEVQRSHREMERSLYRRDMTEIAAAIFVTVLFAFLAVALDEWTLYLCAVGGFGVGLFFVVDRYIQSRQLPIPDESLQSHLHVSLAQVRHQIWLLKNILWWYLLPIIPGVVAFLVSVSWKSGWQSIGEQFVILTVGLICAFAFWQVHRINQRAVKTLFEPRQEELKNLLSSITGKF